MQVWCQHGQNEVQPERAYSIDSYRKEAFSCKFGGKIISPKINLKKHAPLIHTEVYILWQLVHYELKPLEAYCAESYWSEAPICTFCDKWQV